MHRRARKKEAGGGIDDSDDPDRKAPARNCSAELIALPLPGVLIWHFSFAMSGMPQACASARTSMADVAAL